MANIIDTLVVELALDPTKFTQAQRQAVAAAKQMHEQMLAQGKEIEAAGERISYFFEGAKRSLLGVLGLMLGGRTLTHFVEMDAAMVRNARTIGVSTEQLAKWGAMARLTGGDINSVTGSMQGLADQIGRAQLTGDFGNLLQITSRLGINLKTTKDGLVDIDALMDDLNRTFQKMDPVSARTIGAMLGLDPSTINLLMMQRQEFLKTREEIERMAKGLGDNAEKANELYKSFQLARGEGDLWIASMVGQWAPQLKAIIDKAREWLHLTTPAPDTPEGQEIVRKNQDEVRRRFGASPWGDPTAWGGVRRLSSDQILSGATVDVDQATNTAGLTLGQRAGREVLPASAFATGGAISPLLAKGYAATLAASFGMGGGTTNNSSTSTHIGVVNVNISGAESPEETGRSVYRWFQRFQSGATTYNGPH